MAQEFEGYDFFDFDNADSFLNSISGSVERDTVSPTSLNEWEPTIKNEMDFNNYADFTTTNSSSNTNNGFVGAGMGQAAQGFDYQSYGSDSYGASSENKDSSVSSQNDLTPVSEPSMSSTQTTPEPKPVSYKPTAYKTKGAANKVTKAKRDKVSHNMIEKKYRTNINSKILELRDAVPALKIASGSKDVSIADLEGLTPAAKLNKASVLTKAIEYIQHLEKKNSMLQKQNEYLNRMIQNAGNGNVNVNVNQNFEGQMSPGHGSNPSPQMQHNQNLSQNSHNSQPDVPFGMYDGEFDIYNDANASYGQQPPRHNKYLLGGVAAVMGTSLLGGGDQDFRGLSAIPGISSLPFSSVSSPVVGQLWYVVKVVLFMACLANLVLPQLFEAPSGKVKYNHLVKNWLFVGFGIQLPNKVDEMKLSGIKNMLLGKTGYSFVQLVRDYMYLSSCESSFEVCFLNLVVGTLLIKQYPFLSKFLSLNMSLKYSLIMNLDCKDPKSAQLNQLIRKLDGVSLFKSDRLVGKLLALLNHQPVDFISVREAEIYQETSGDLFNLIYSWRLLEILDELNLVYLSNILIEDEEEQLDKNNKLVKDLKLIEKLIESDTKPTGIVKYFRLFKTVVLSREGAVELMKSMKHTVDTKLAAFETEFNGLELTDDEIVSEDEEYEEDQESEEDSNLNGSDGVKLSLNHEITKTPSKSLVKSLNLVSQEQFIVLNCAVINYYQSKGRKVEAFKLLKYFKQFDTKALSTLSFTSLLKLITVLVTKDNIQDTEITVLNSHEVLDSLIKTTRLWLNNHQSLLHEDLRSNLSDVIVSKGLLMTGNDTSDDD